MTERAEKKRRDEALGWLVGRLAWEQGLRFDTELEQAAAKTPEATEPAKPAEAA